MGSSEVQDLSPRPGAIFRVDERSVWCRVVFSVRSCVWWSQCFCVGVAKQSVLATAPLAPSGVERDRAQREEKHDWVLCLHCRRQCPQEQERREQSSDGEHVLCDDPAQGSIVSSILSKIFMRPNSTWCCVKSTRVSPQSNSQGGQQPLTPRDHARVFQSARRLYGVKPAPTSTLTRDHEKEALK